MLSDYDRNIANLIPPKSEADVSQKHLNGELDLLSYCQRYKKSVTRHNFCPNNLTFSETFDSFITCSGSAFGVGVLQRVLILLLEAHFIANPTSPLISVSPEEIGNLHGANENSPRSAEIKLRKNEMKLRKNEMKVPMNFSFPPWIFEDFHRGIARFP